MLPVQGADCSTAFVCEVANYQRMHLDGRLQELESEPSGIFQAFKSLPRRSCFWRGSADPLTGQHPIRYI